MAGQGAAAPFRSGCPRAGMGVPSGPPPEASSWPSGLKATKLFVTLSPHRGSCPARQAPTAEWWPAALTVPAPGDRPGATGSTAWPRPVTKQVRVCASAGPSARSAPRSCYGQLLARRAEGQGIGPRPVTDHRVHSSPCPGPRTPPARHGAHRGRPAADRSILHAKRPDRRRLGTPQSCVSSLPVARSQIFNDASVARRKPIRFRPCKSEHFGTKPLCPVRACTPCPWWRPDVDVAAFHPREHLLAVTLKATDSHTARLKPSSRTPCRWSRPTGRPCRLAAAASTWLLSEGQGVDPRLDPSQAKRTSLRWPVPQLDRPSLLSEASSAPSVLKRLQRTSRHWRSGYRQHTRHQRTRARLKSTMAAPRAHGGIRGGGSAVEGRWQRLRPWPHLPPAACPLSAAESAQLAARNVGSMSGVLDLGSARSARRGRPPDWGSPRAPARSGEDDLSRAGPPAPAGPRAAGDFEPQPAPFSAAFRNLRWIRTVRRVAGSHEGTRFGEDPGLPCARHRPPKTLSRTAAGPAEYLLQGIDQSSGSLVAIFRPFGAHQLADHRAKSATLRPYVLPGEGAPPHPVR